jgi:hypothetical protein
VRRLLVLVLVASVPLALAAPASASQLIDRDATKIRLKVSRGGKAG